MFSLRPFGLLTLLQFALIATPCKLLSAAEPAVAQLDARIAAGEFSTAIAAAEQLPVAQRDAALLDVAAAQASAGAKQAAVATVATIRDDALRQDVLGQMFGGGSGIPGEAPAPGSSGGSGGGVQPDFDSLIELMTSTIAPETWREAGGTQGEVRPHNGGVYVDAAGAMRTIVNSSQLARLGGLRREAARDAGARPDIRQASPLRKISLPRLERELQIRAAQGLPVEVELQALAGLRKIQYVFVYPETGDVVLAGPAGDWYLGRENRLLAVDTDRPVVLLDDFVTLLRREFAGGGIFGCSIDPTPEGLEALSAFVAESAKKPLPPGGRMKWTEELGKRLGVQKITVSGLEPTSRAAAVLVEADYRMKLLGVGKEESIAEVPNYLQLVASAKSSKPPALDLVRWWFTVNYEALSTSQEHDVYELRGPGVMLQSENEFLAARGERVQSGQANDPNREFAANFTRHFAALAQKHPIYAELQNIFDLALVCAVLKHDGVCERIGWRRSGLMDPNVYATETRAVPATVDTVAQSRELTRTLIVATASGGVTVDVAAVAKPESMQIESRQQLAKVRRSEKPLNLPDRGWWWD